MKTVARLAALALLALTGCSTTMAPVATGATTPRACPDWSRSSREDFSNRDGSNFGCADAVNFQAQLADPGDALRGRGGAAGDSIGAAGAVRRLRGSQTAPAAGKDTPAPASPGTGT